MLRRLPNSANAYALGWLTVTALNPTDLFNSGCQLSFLSVAVLYWGTNRWFRADSSAYWQPDDATRPRSSLMTWLLGTSDPLERLIDESRPWWLRFLRKLARDLVLAYAVTLAIWLALIPLVASRYNMVSFVGILLGPPTVLLTSIALVAGFLLLLLAPICSPLVPVLAWVVRWCLMGCNGLVYLGDNLPGGHWYLGDVPDWWLWVFYPIRSFGSGLAKC